MIIQKRVNGTSRLYDTDNPDTIYPLKIREPIPNKKPLLCDLVPNEKEFLQQHFPNQPSVLYDFCQAWYYVVSEVKTQDKTTNVSVIFAAAK